MHLGDLDEALVGLVLEHHHAFHREIRRVDLQDQAGLVDRAVFLADLAGERHHVGLVRVVVRVHQRGRDDAGRRRGHELLGEGAAGMLLEARDLVADRAHVGVFHVGDRLRGIGDLGAMHEAPAERRHQVGMLDEVLADAALRLAAIAAHARRHVGLERDALLLAVIADVDAGVLLPLDHLGDRTVELVRHFFRIDRLASLALDQQLGDRLVARQAADMGGQNAVAAGEHAGSPLWRSWLGLAAGHPRLGIAPVIRRGCPGQARRMTELAAHAAHSAIAKKNARSFSRAARPCARS